MPKCEWLDQSINEAYFWHGSGKAKERAPENIELSSSENPRRAAAGTDPQTPKFQKVSNV
eukprot:4230900-Amphidinium_carterae.1